MTTQTEAKAETISTNGKSNGGLGGKTALAKFKKAAMASRPSVVEAVTNTMPSLTPAPPPGSQQTAMGNVRGVNGLNQALWALGMFRHAPPEFKYFDPELSEHLEVTINWPTAAFLRLRNYNFARCSTRRCACHERNRPMKQSTSLKPSAFSYRKCRIPFSFASLLLKEVCSSMIKTLGVLDQLRQMARQGWVACTTYPSRAGTMGASGYPCNIVTR